VGESAAVKSNGRRLFLRLVEPSRGRLKHLDGKDPSWQLDSAWPHKARLDHAMIFQDRLPSLKSQMQLSGSSGRTDP